MNRPPTQQRATLRLVRAALLGGSSGTLAVAAHALAGGGAPDTGLTAILTLLIALAGTALADRSSRALPLIGVLGVSHAGEHLLLTTLAHQHSATPDGLLMTGTHLLAVLCTAALLAGAEASVCAGLAALGMLLPRLSLAVPPPPAARPMPVRLGDRPSRTEHSVLLSQIIGRRGPPVLS